MIRDQKTVFPSLLFRNHGERSHSHFGDHFRAVADGIPRGGVPGQERAEQKEYQYTRKERQLHVPARVYGCLKDFGLLDHDDPESADQVVLLFLKDSDQGFVLSEGGLRRRRCHIKCQEIALAEGISADAALFPVVAEFSGDQGVQVALGYDLLEEACALAGALHYVIEVLGRDVVDSGILVDISYSYSGRCLVDGLSRRGKQDKRQQNGRRA